MADKKAKRERGRILTDSGWNKLDAALQTWEVLSGNKRTFERIGLEAHLDPGTVAKILKRREGADLSKIEQVFRAFKLNVDDQDHAPVLQEVAQIADPNFVGREEAIADLNTLISRDAKVIVIQARGGVGKTTLARKYLQQEFERVLEFPIAKETKDIASIESLIEEKLRQLGEEPGREFLVSIDRLKRKLQSDRVGILIDNLEPALDSAGKFIEPHRRYVELLRVLADPSVRSLTLITSRERLNEYSISVQPYLLRELSLEAWKQFFLNRFRIQDSEKKEFEDATVLALTNLQNAYGGNAKAMDILCGAILTDHGGDIVAYWKVNQNDLLIERALEDLVVGQFDRLQQLDPDAYKLLCRMGCYRYQDVPTVPIEGLLCLLWDVPENKQRRVVRSLMERSLVDCEDSEFWLHPVIRGEAIGRLRDSEDCKEANRRAAKFWTESVSSIDTIRQALAAFEAYYQYVEIKDFEQSAKVIVNERCNRWGNESELSSEPICTLGASFIRLGLFHQIIVPTTQALNHINPGYQLSRLYNILGDCYWLAGRINEAIQSHQTSGEIAAKCNLKRLELASIFNMALCKEDLWEFQEAIELYRRVLSRAEEIGDGKLQKQALYGLAHIYSYSNGDREKVARLIERVQEESEDVQLGVRSFGYKLYAVGFSFGYIGMIDQAVEMYRRAILYSERSGFVHLKGMSLTGLAVVFRDKKEYEKAFFYHVEAIELLNKIGATNNLAKAYHQMGLTYQEIGEADPSNDNFQEAIRLFTEMKAPKQVERVRRSMNGKT